MMDKTRLVLILFLAIGFASLTASKVKITDSGVYTDGQSFWHEGIFQKTDYLPLDGSSDMEGSLNLSGNSILGSDVIKAGSSGTGNLGLYTSGSGSSEVSIYDSSRSGNPMLLQAEEGGNLKIPNATLDLNDNKVKNQSVENWNDVSYQNGWTDYGSSYAPAAYYKNAQNRVFLRGLIESGSTETVAFTLPANYRPANRKIFSAITSTNSGGTSEAACRIDVETDGEVYIHDACDSNWVSLENIDFRAN